ncbi:hypothetical protein ARMGADRAFT_1037612 [Armillaria gallica]|uniref:Uncharacterized protein n=1 Tax=Armillaria gallica TaxID=47427 RepID=A0A2H3CZ66_ARMGA|nr:hypothetical protein ARMGADRAFT_1037612 [Armillaria gallica]
MPDTQSKNGKRQKKTLASTSQLVKSKGKVVVMEEVKDERLDREMDEAFNSITMGLRVEKYHQQWDSYLYDEDPLRIFRAVDGSLPNTMTEETMQLRDIIIRLYLPNKEAPWKRLPDAVDDLLETPITKDSLVKEVRVGQIWYELKMPHIHMWGHVLLAVEQVLEDFADFLWRKSSAAYKIDPCFQFLIERILHVRTMNQLSVYALDHHGYSYQVWQGRSGAGASQAGYEARVLRKDRGSGPRRASKPSRLQETSLKPAKFSRINKLKTALITGTFHADAHPISIILGMGRVKPLVDEAAK